MHIFPKPPDMTSSIHASIIASVRDNRPLLAVLIDPEEFDPGKAVAFLATIPNETDYLFVGGSTANADECSATISALKDQTSLPVILFPGDYSQISPQADALLFLSLLSGRNPEYLIGQHVKAVPAIRQSELEVIPTGYLLIDGGKESAVERVTQTTPLHPNDVQQITDTALAGTHLGMQLVYLEAGSGALEPVSAGIIKKVSSEIDVPLIVGGGIRTEAQRKAAYEAGADMVVMGTVFEEKG